MAFGGALFVDFCGDEKKRDVTGDFLGEDTFLKKVVIGGVEAWTVALEGNLALIISSIHAGSL